MVHPVLQEMGLSCDELLDVIKRSDRCYMTVRGYVAERHLEKYLQQLKDTNRIDNFRFVNQEGKPDFEVSREGRTKSVECKNVLRGGEYSNGDLKVDFQRTRNQLGGGARTGRYYKLDDFDILAACEYNSTAKWEFKFIATSELPKGTIEGIICLIKAVHVPRDITGTKWTMNLDELVL